MIRNMQKKESKTKKKEKQIFSPESVCGSEILRILNLLIPYK